MLSHLPTDPALPPVPARLHVRSFGLTDPGKVRPNNEDQFLIAAMAKTLRVQLSSLPQPDEQTGDEQGYIFVVADGMGGHQAGEQASALALTTIEEYVRNSMKWFLAGAGADSGAAAALHHALDQADERIIAAGREDPALRGMGTTLTLAYNLGAQLFVVHVGDSRAYLLHGGELRQITHDQTLVQELVQHGQIPPEEATRHPYRHVITSALGGGDPGFRVEIRRIELSPGDVVLLCTDGLHDLVPAEKIRDTLAAAAEPEAACQALVQQANDQGGRDNITVIVARFDSPR